MVLSADISPHYTAIANLMVVLKKYWSRIEKEKLMGMLIIRRFTLALLRGYISHRKG